MKQQRKTASAKQSAEGSGGVESRQKKAAVRKKAAARRADPGSQRKTASAKQPVDGARTMRSYPGMPPSGFAMSLADTALNALSPYADLKTHIRLRIAETDRLQPVEIPANALVLLLDILKATTEGKSVTISAWNDEVTTTQAASMLNVSRPYVIKLLEDGEIPYRKVGSHRRIRTEDVVTYKAASYRRSEAALDQLVAEAQAMGYYDT